MQYGVREQRANSSKSFVRSPLRLRLAFSSGLGGLARTWTRSDKQKEAYIAKSTAQDSISFVNSVLVSSFYLFLCVGVADSFALAPSSPGSPPPSPPLLSRITNGYSIHALTFVEITITPLLSLLVPKLETKDTLTNMREKRGAERHPLEHGSATFNDWARDDDQDLASETETDGANWSKSVPLLMGIEKPIKSWAVIPLPPRLIQVRFQTPGHRSSSHSVYLPLLSCTVSSLFQNPG